jgi:glycosyltransferase involved in cell wall biosynthesis
MPIDLLLISPGFPANEGDDTCIPPLQEYLLALRATRPDLAIQVIATQYPYTVTPYGWKDIRVHPCNGRNGLWRQPGTFRRARRVFRGILERGGVRCVHSLWIGSAAVFGARCAVAAKARHVITAMGQDARDGSRAWERSGQGASSVVLSDRHASFFLRMTRRRPDAIIPWGSPPPPREGNTERTIDLLFVGSMIDVKRPWLFEELVHRVRRHRPVKAMMIGRQPDGTHGPGDHDIAPDGSTLRVLTELPREEVLERMSNARVLVHTSSYESQGYVFDEALASGMSIVSFAVGSAVRSDRWRVVEDMEEMVTAVIELLEAPPPIAPMTLHPMERTVEAYLQLYGLA